MSLHPKARSAVGVRASPLFFMLKNILASALTSFSLSDYCSTKTSRSFCYTLIRYCFCYFGVSAYAKSDSSSAIFYANITICSNEQRVAMQSEYAQRREVECNLLHHFIFLKNVCFCNCFVCFGYVLLFLFTLGAYKEKKKYQEKEKSACFSELFEFIMPC